MNSFVAYVNKKPFNTKAEAFDKLVLYISVKFVPSILMEKVLHIIWGFYEDFLCLHIKSKNNVSVIQQNSTIV